MIAFRLLVAFLLVVSSQLLGCKGRTAAEKGDSSRSVAAVENHRVNFSKEVENVLKQKIEIVKAQLQDEAVVGAVRQSNVDHREISNGEIQQLDKEWRESDMEAKLIKDKLTNSCADILVGIQEKHKGFSEIFVTDEKGLNVCQTNRTSDYYQADEDWWVKGFNNGVGLAYWGEIEFDESARSEAISVYVPILDLDSRQALGVAKAVIDITQIKREI